MSEMESIPNVTDSHSIGSPGGAYLDRFPIYTMSGRARLSLGKLVLASDSAQIELKELLGEPGELFWHMAPSAPSKASVVVCGSHNGSTWSYTTLSMISMCRIRAYSSVLEL